MFLLSYILLIVNRIDNIIGTSCLRLLTAWMAVVAWALVIFYFSTLSNLSTNLGTWDFILRKMVHAAEFGILCYLLWRALRLHLASPGIAVIMAATVSLIYAASDEYHQTFVQGRSGKITDVGFDLTGIMIVVLLIGIHYRYRRTG